MTENVRGHEHLVSVVNQGDGMECDACDQLHVGGYSCSECKFNIHKKCVYVFTAKEIFDHPSHDGHCLKLLTTGAPDHTDPKCHLCGKNTKRLLYHCSDCKLNLDIGCIADHRSAPFHLNMSWHHHPLVLGLSYFDRCSFCHKIGNEDSKGYRCLRCGLVIHTRCTFIFDSQEITHPAHSDDSPTACSACLQVCSEGFVYDHDTYGTFDLLCSSIDVPFIHGSHPHPLLYLKLQHGHFKTCQSCGIDHTKVVIGTFIVLGWVDYDPEFFCSFYCFKSHLKFHFDEYHTVCPPWALELESNTRW
ncbi:unnamed protein product [Arabidopsis thaliana]|uniref:(thale cress) hypothetical protein n=1 Tax=Arabidopsis thaliana TaxID=3702 RepID=A0A7G2ETR8_ARATH|nr:unnamed protein product [Arabidopsis thaliana]